MNAVTDRILMKAQKEKMLEINETFTIISFGEKK